MRNLLMIVQMDRPRATEYHLVHNYRVLHINRVWGHFHGLFPISASVVGNLTPPWTKTSLNHLETIIDICIACVWMCFAICRLVNAFFTCCYWTPTYFEGFSLGDRQKHPESNKDGYTPWPEKNGPPKHVKIPLWIENVSDYFSLYHEMPSICNVHVKFHDN